MKIYFKSTFILLSFLICSWTFAGISVELSPTSIKRGETFRLTLTVDSIQNHDTPNWHPLLKDFDILGTDQTMSYIMIRGQARAISQWSVLLRPKKSGTLPVPAIQIGQAQSMPSQIIVNDHQEKSSIQDEEKVVDESIFLASVDKSKPLIHEQITYTVRLLTQQRLLDAQYQPPHVDNALLLPLGDGRHYQTRLKGVLYEVEEQKYAIFPQKSGPLTIEPPHLDALAYGEMGPSRISLKAKAIEMDVLPPPENQSLKHWLPADAVELSESYDEHEKNVLEGDTVTRTITLKAKGVVAELLPNIRIQSTSAWRAYVEKPVLDNHLENGRLWGKITIQVTYLLSKTGKVEFPPLVISWYNLSHKKIEKVSLPAKLFFVHPRPGEHATVKHKQTKPISSISPPDRVSTHYGVTMISLMILLITCVLSITYLFWRKNRSSNPQHSDVTIEDKTLSLKHACKNNQPHQARAALIQWAKTQWPSRNILNLDDIPIDDPFFKDEIARLSQALYAPKHDGVWSGELLWRWIAKQKFSPQRKRKKSTELPPINPT